MGPDVKQAVVVRSYFSSLFPTFVRLRGFVFKASTLRELYFLYQITDLMQ